MRKRFLVVILFLLIVITTALSIYYFQLTTKKVTVQNTINSENYKINTGKIPDSVQKRLSDAGLSEFKQIIEINQNDSHPIAWYLHRDTKRSGFSFQVSEETILISIYINQIVNNSDILNELNRSYLTALLYAAEHIKPVYDNDYSKLQLIGQEIFEKAFSDNKLPIS